MADSNVLMPRDYLQRLFAGWRADTGLSVRAAHRLPAGRLLGRGRVRLPQHLSGALAVRRRHASASASRRARRMLWRRTDLERAGGIRALGAEIAEDAAATKVVRRAGKRVRLVDRAFGQPLGCAQRTADLVAAAALGEAAPRHLPALLSSPRCFSGLLRAARRRRAYAAEALDVLGCRRRRRARRRVVRLRSAPGARRRLAH